MKNPVDSILSFGLIKNIWKWNFLSTKKNLQRIFKDSYNKTKFMIKIWNDNNLLNTLKKITISKMWNFKTWKFKTYTFENSKIQNSRIFYHI
jgi:hypothetical protein